MPILVYTFRKVNNVGITPWPSTRPESQKQGEKNMENASLFGIPYAIVGFLCFLIAGVFIFVWPKSKAKILNTLNFPKFVLHYFHPLAWVLIGMAAFMQRGYPEMAAVVAGLGILSFGMFLFIFIRS
jgi:hypothetical protein